MEAVKRTVNHAKGAVPTCSAHRRPRPSSPTARHNRDKPWRAEDWPSPLLPFWMGFGSAPSSQVSLRRADLKIRIRSSRQDRARRVACASTKGALHAQHYYIRCAQSSVYLVLLSRIMIFFFYFLRYTESPRNKIS